MDPQNIKPDLPQEQINKQVVKQSQPQIIISKSQKYQTYISYMSPFLKFFKYNSKQTENIKMNQLSYILRQKKLLIRQKMGDYFLEVYFQNSSKNNQYILIDIRYGNRFLYSIPIAIRNHLSHFHERCQTSSGNFANVYKAKINGQPIAIKCFSINENSTIHTQFLRILKQFLILSLAGNLGVAPQTGSLKGFQIFIYRTCVQFTMEYCKQIVQYDPQMEYDLKQGLAQMHRNKIIHFDIKPQNICYCPRLKKYVFIDFGLSEIIQNQLGQKITIKFRGSLGYCSDQMKNCSKLVYGQIDPYYNDIHCLERTLQILKQSQLNIRQEQDLFQMDAYFKYLQIYSYFLNFQSLNRQYRLQLIQTIYTIKSYQTCEKILQVINQFTITIQLQTLFNLLKQHERQLGYKGFSKACLLAGNQLSFTQYKAVLIHQDVGSVYDQIFGLQVSKYIDFQMFQMMIIRVKIELIGGNQYELIEQIKQSLYMRMIDTAQLTVEEILKAFYRKLVGDFKGRTKSPLTYACFAQLMPSLLLLQVISNQQFMDFISMVIQQLEKPQINQIDEQLWIITFFKFIISLEWIRFIYKQAYSYEHLKITVKNAILKSALYSKGNKYNIQTRNMYAQFFGLYLLFQKIVTLYNYYQFSSKLIFFASQIMNINEVRDIILYFICQFFNHNVSLDFQAMVGLTRIMNSIIINKKQIQKTEFSPFYLNIMGCISKIDQKLVKWIRKLYKDSFSQYSFYTDSLFYFYQNYHIIDFQRLSMFIRNKQGIDTILYRIIKMVLLNKYGCFLHKEDQLNSFILSFKDNINQLLTALKGKMHLNLMHDEYNHHEYMQEFVTIFRLFAQQFIFNHENAKKEIHQFSEMMIEMKEIRCYSCKQLHFVYSSILDSILLILQSKFDKSLKLFLNILSYCRKNTNCKGLIKQSLSLYYHFAISLNQEQLNILTAFITDIVLQDKQLLLHIIIDLPQLYSQIFKQKLLLNSQSVLLTLIYPSVYLLQQNSTPQFCETLHKLFSYSWFTLQSELQPNLYKQIYNHHLYTQISTCIQSILKDQQDHYYHFLIYVLTFFQNFEFDKKGDISLFKFISYGIDYHRGDVKNLFILQFYQIFNRINQNRRYTRFKEKIKWKYGMKYVDNKQVVFLQSIKALSNRHKGKYRIYYQILFDKACKYSLSIK